MFFPKWPCWTPVLLILAPSIARAGDTADVGARQRSPRIGAFLPAPGADGSYSARVGQRFELAVEASDPDGDRLIYGAAGLPASANLDAETGLLSWTPGPRDLGPRLFKLTVSDGSSLDSQTVRVQVVANAAPSIARTSVDFVTGMSTTVPLDASDPDDDALSCSSPDLPEGARVEPDCVSLSWSPTRAQVGSSEATIVISDGANEIRTPLWLQVSADRGEEEEWESYFLPGAGWVVYGPRAGSELGVMQGPVLEVVLGSWIHRNENRGPSHGRVLAYMERFDSTSEANPVTLGYGLGFSLSLERNPQRRWLIPFYGVDLGGLRQDGAPARFHWTPQAGVHVWSSQNVFVNARAGYRLVPGSLERWSGWYAGIGADVTVW